MRECARIMLYVKTLNRCALEWEGKEIFEGNGADVKCLQLLFAVLHAGAEGMEEGELLTAVFGKEAIEKGRRDLEETIAEAEEGLQAAGLPPVVYIEERAGRFYWTPKIPFWEDTARLEELYRLARREEEPKRRLSLYLEACHTYGDAYLKGREETERAGEAARCRRIFTEREEAVCHRIFAESVEGAAGLLRQKKEYEELEQLGRYASKADPLGGWEEMTLEALVAEGRSSEARSFYREALGLYLREQGFCPADSREGMVKKLGRQMGCRWAFSCETSWKEVK